MRWRLARVYAKPIEPHNGEKYDHVILLFLHLMHPFWTSLSFLYENYEMLERMISLPNCQFLSQSLNKQALGRGIWWATANSKANILQRRWLIDTSNGTRTSCINTVNIWCNLRGVKLSGCCLTKIVGQRFVLVLGESKHAKSKIHVGLVLQVRLQLGNNIMTIMGD